MSDNNSIDNITEPDYDSRTYFEKLVSTFFLAIVAFVTYIVLNINPVDRWLAVEIPKRNYRIVAKALILFVVIFIVDCIISKEKCI
jgi:hypothetical protein